MNQPITKLCVTSSSQRSVSVATASRDGGIEPQTAQIALLLRDRVQEPAVPDRYGLFLTGIGMGPVGE
jgi:hypothetical protein